MSEWISVKDQVPGDSDKLVLVYCGTEVGIGGWSKDYGWWVTGINDDDDAEVTHWAVLPEAPK
jgi:hypothetical protein